jgi:hypothetical protein
MHAEIFLNAIRESLDFGAYPVLNPLKPHTGASRHGRLLQLTLSVCHMDPNISKATTGKERVVAACAESQSTSLGPNYKLDHE